MSAAESLAQGAVERLLENESLRGDLTDAGFAPIVDWATTTLIAAARGLRSRRRRRPSAGWTRPRRR